MTDTAPEIATTHGTDLVIAPEQTSFTDQQRAALDHMGVGEAPEADLHVFFHRAKTTGLDPFSGQIHMIGRKSWDSESRSKIMKYTIQTGIDGYRLIARRAADAAGHVLSMSEPAWMHQDGTWREAWSRQWGYPIASRVIVYRDGQPFPGVAMFDEYVQTTKDKDGNVRPNSMWEQRPAGQLAKCAEALALRKAYPADLASIYTDDEMGQTDGDGTVRSAGARPARRRATAAAFTAQVVPGVVVGSDATDAEVVPDEEPMGEAQREDLNDLFWQYGVTDNVGKVTYLADTLGRDVSQHAPMSRSEADQVIEKLRANIAEQKYDGPGSDAG